MTTPIPQPPTIPFLGNVGAVETEVPLRSFELLAKQYGEIYRLSFFGRELIVITSYELLNEVCDERRFKKSIAPALAQVRNLVGDGLFTAYNDEPNWAIAHRLLMPAFNAASIRGMMDDMKDVASQLLLKWERFGPNHVIEPSEDFTRLALETICLTSMSYRMNCFYMQEMPPFAGAMTDFLKECNMRSRRPAILQSMMSGANAKYEADRKLMTDLADEIVAERKRYPIEKNDLLAKMLEGKDPKTGEGLSDRAITNNLLTFLIAGHETTSGTLSFMCYYLLKNPECMRKLREEVDEVLGDQEIQLGDLNKLPYLIAVMRETLRLSPPAAARGMAPLEDTTLLNGKYSIAKGQNILIHVSQAHRDPAVWGDDAEEFRPERNLDGKFEALPPNAWQPFGFGMRACIGRAFAWQEIIILMTSIIQKFDLAMVDPSYNLELKQNLTIKPNGFYIRAIPRADRRTLSSHSSTFKSPQTQPVPRSSAGQTVGNADVKQKLYVLYGSNTGTSESFAQRIASEAPAHGFRATLGTLDSATERMPTDGPVVIVTASFEGEPADNAAHFVEWLSSLKGQEFVNVKYAVFGCGNRDWVKTFQRIPTLIDDLFAERGAQRLVERGFGDAGSGDFFEKFDEWEASMWQILAKEYSTSESKSSVGFQVKTIDAGTARASALRQPDAALGTVVDNKLLTAKNAPAKHHLEFELPEGTAYRAGDYLAILPVNPRRDVHRVLSRFGLSPEQEIVINSEGPTSLPVDKPILVNTLLSGYLELSQPATTRDLRFLSHLSGISDSTAVAMKNLSASYQQNVLEKRLSILDILEAHKDLQIDFAVYLNMLPSMRVRQYSISSSPLWNPRLATLTVSILEAAPISGRDESFLGVASTYLSGLKPGDRVQMSVRASAAAFHPPTDPSTPMVMFCAGSGLAPMRGFIQERAMQKESGRENIGKILLFFGCRHPEEDYLYGKEELKKWSEEGVVDVRPAFSRKSEESEGCKYIQDRIWHDRDDIRKAFRAGATFFTCGSSKIAAGVKQKLLEIIHLDLDPNSTEDIEEVWARILKGRYATDVFE